MTYCPCACGSFVFGEKRDAALRAPHWLFARVSRALSWGLVSAYTHCRDLIQSVASAALCAFADLSVDLPPELQTPASNSSCPSHVDVSPAH